ncbi:MAG TPA: hypothetical protein PLP05_01995 [Sedimentisphaerales bacterium]|nr:hypothetical protein [Sedimentisphaerales bacterium]
MFSKYNYLLLCFILIGFVRAGFAYNAAESRNFAGPYSTAMDNFNPVAADAGIAGFTGPDGRGVCPSGENDVYSGNSTNIVNPVFKSWASGYANYIPAPAANESLIGHETYSPLGGVPAIWRKPYESLGMVTGDNFNVCVLGDLWSYQIAVLDPNNENYMANKALAFNDPYKIQPGQITLSFNEAIQDGPGPDFAVFENGFISAGGAGVVGQIFAELAYVEVSTDGETFVRFPCVSLTGPVSEGGGTGAYGTIDPTNVYNIAGKHVNAYTSSWGTPFNLKDLACDPNVLNNSVDVNEIYYVRIVDIPGNGFFKDSAIELIDPNTIDPNSGEGGTYYTETHGIHDAWVTWGSGGCDLEAIGVIEQIYGDADSNGQVDFIDFARMAFRWNKYGNWPQGDFDENHFIDINDLKLLGENWLYHSSSR